MTRRSGYHAFAELKAGACSATLSVAWDKTVATVELRTAAAK